MYRQQFRRRLVGTFQVREFSENLGYFLTWNHKIYFNLKNLVKIGKKLTY